MKTYLVGGAVRDQLLNYPFNERDWVVVGASPEQMLQQGFRPVGNDFPVFIHPQTGEEYALARTERKTAPGYKGFVFHTDPDVSLEEDLERRDLTINAMAQDEDGDIIDPYDGQDDLDKRCLRHVSLAFIEDPVRILRVARFSARYHHLGFKVATDTLDLMHAMVERGETRHLVAERVWQECYKALEERSPLQFFSVLTLCEALKDIFPELVDAGSYQACLQQLQRVSTNSQEPLQRFAALCQGLSLVSIESLCKRLGTPNTFRDLALLLKKHYADLQQMASIGAEQVLAIIQQCDASRKTERFDLLVKTCQLLNEPNDKQIFAFWQQALVEYQAVDPQALIAQGFQKAALGDALKQARLEQLMAYCQQYKSE